MASSVPPVRSARRRRRPPRRARCSTSRRSSSSSIQRNASDLHLKVGRPPTLRLHGDLVPLDHPGAPSRGSEGARRTAHDAAPGEGVHREQGVRLRHRRAGHRALPRATSISSAARSASRCARSRIRRARSRSSTCPTVLEEIALKPRGLVLVTGITGSGKSTALAAMVQHINEHRHANVITIEDPIEFLHRDINCHINQREVGTDTATFGAGAAPRAATGSGRHPHRRDPRPRDARHGAQGGRHGTPRVQHAAHDRRDADDQPRAVLLPAAPAGRGALLARERAAGGHLAPPRAARRQAGPRSRVRGAHQHADRARPDPRHGQDAQHSGPHQGRHGAVRDAELRPVAHAATTRRASISYESAVFYATSPSEFALRVQGVAGTSDNSWSAFESDSQS